MFTDDDVFNEIEEIIEKKKKRYERALQEEVKQGRILSRVTELENSLIDAYIKLIRTKYWVRERRFVGSEEAESEINEFLELVGEE